MSACLADRPRTTCKLSTRYDSAGCSSCSSCVLERFHFDSFGQLFLAISGFADRPRGRRGLSVRHELLVDRSFFQGVLLEILLAFRTIRRNLADRPPPPRGPSARSPRTVRLGLRRVAKFFALSFDFTLGLFGVCS
jgi:hypothetical protein